METPDCWGRQSDCFASDTSAPLGNTSATSVNMKCYQLMPAVSSSFYFVPSNSVLTTKTWFRNRFCWKYLFVKLWLFLIQSLSWIAAVGLLFWSSRWKKCWEFISFLSPYIHTANDVLWIIEPYQNIFSVQNELISWQFPPSVCVVWLVTERWDAISSQHSAQPASLHASLLVGETKLAVAAVLLAATHHRSVIYQNELNWLINIICFGIVE